MPLTEVYPKLTEEERDRVLKTVRGEIVEHDGRHWMSFVTSTFDGMTTKLVTVGDDNFDHWKDVILYKDKDKPILSSDTITQDRIDNWLSSKYDIMGMYF